MKSQHDQLSNKCTEIIITKKLNLNKIVEKNKANKTQTSSGICKYFWQQNNKPTWLHVGIRCLQQRDDDKWTRINSQPNPLMNGFSQTWLITYLLNKTNNNAWLPWLPDIATSSKAWGWDIHKWFLLLWEMLMGWCFTNPQATIMQCCRGNQLIPHWLVTRCNKG
jgi:hypothetical protein